MPTRAAFIQEVLDARPTPVTPKFHDAADSYHILKEDLLKGLVEESEKRKLSLRGVLIAGPMPFDPLWTYVVSVFIQDGDKVRINLLDFAHARITYKGTGIVTGERFGKWISDLKETGVLRRSFPPQPERKGREEEGESVQRPARHLEPRGEGPSG